MYYHFIPGTRLPPFSTPPSHSGLLHDNNMTAIPVIFVMDKPAAATALSSRGGIPIP
jgi:hypothetical protein